MVNPLVSIIVPNYNYGRFISETLRSILRQTFTDYEVIVIDDGSTDNSRDVVDHMASDFGERLTYIYQNNQGVSAARNKGIKTARGQYIAFIDADDIWLIDTLGKLVNFLENNPNISMVYGNTEFFDSSTYKSLGFDHGNNSLKIPYTGKCIDQLFIRGNFIPIMTTLTRREVFNSIGFFDVRFRVGEDLDMWLRLTASYEIGYINEVLCRVRRHGNNLTFNYLEDIKVEIIRTRKVLRMNPRLKEFLGEDIITKKWYLAYYHLGMQLILKSDRKKGRRWLKKALKLNLNPFINKIYIYYCLSYLPFIGIIDKARQSWRCINSLFHMNRGQI